MGIIEKIKKPRKAPAKAAPKKAAASVEATGKVSLHGNAHRVLLAPIVSEKSTLKEALHTYTFRVEKNANKIEIAKAIEEVYGVKPLAVRTIHVQGKETHFGRRIGRRSDYKKAIVKVSKDQRLAIHEGV